ncbi:hypothetical protein [Chitinolyticbacter meiyuanensis]|uniref:hypothetical protein n=1 Tax=Chitinolyticbacter meiyuanensis TaxID=682798 RepID=UPI001C9E3718|nr:hypothetical protein [Chitinolyticbacter meiyuanensis]
MGQDYLDRLANAELLERLRAGVKVDSEQLTAKSVQLLGQGDKHAWLKIVPEEGATAISAGCWPPTKWRPCDWCAVAIGTLQLGELAKGQWHLLRANEVVTLGRTTLKHQPRSSASSSLLAAQQPDPGLRRFTVYTYRIYRILAARCPQRSPWHRKGRQWPDPLLTGLRQPAQPVPCQ